MDLTERKVRDWSLLILGTGAEENITFSTKTHNPSEGPVKLIKRVKIAHSFLQSESNQFHVIILSLPM